MRNTHSGTTAAGRLASCLGCPNKHSHLLDKQEPLPYSPRGRARPRCQRTPRRLPAACRRCSPWARAHWSARNGPWRAAPRSVAGPWLRLRGRQGPRAERRQHRRRRGRAHAASETSAPARVTLGGCQCRLAGREAVRRQWKGCARGLRAEETGARAGVRSWDRRRNSWKLKFNRGGPPDQPASGSAAGHAAGIFW